MKLKEKINKFGFVSLVLSCSQVWGQSAWPSIQAEHYPLAPGLDLIRHEDSILLGEGAEQTGLFFARHPKAHTQEVQSKLVVDALKKGWTLKTAMRQGTSYTLTFSKKQRLLDVRLSMTANGVDAVYSVVVSQQPAIESGTPGVTEAQ